MKFDSLIRTLCTVLVLVLLALTSSPSIAQEQEEEKQEEEKQEEEETSFLERKIGDNWILSPVILPIYSPETELALAIGGLAT